MQETLPRRSNIYFSYRTKIKPKKNFSIYALTITLCVVFSIVLFNHIIDYGKNYNHTQTYFLLSLNQAKTKSQAQRLKDAADEAVKVSFIYNINGLYHIVGFVYTEEKEAKKALKDIVEFFVNVKIIELKVNKIKRPIYSKLKSDEKLYYIYKFENSLLNKTLKFCKEVNDNLSLNDFYRKLTKLELMLSRYSDELKNIKSSSIVECLQVSYLMMESFIRLCKDNIIVGKNVVEEAKLLYLNVSFEIFELKNQLNNL